MHSCLKGWEFTLLGMPMAATLPRSTHGTLGSLPAPLSTANQKTGQEVALDNSHYVQSLDEAVRKHLTRI